MSAMRSVFDASLARGLRLTAAKLGQYLVRMARLYVCRRVRLVSAILIVAKELARIDKFWIHQASLSTTEIFKYYLRISFTI